MNKKKLKIKKKQLLRSEKTATSGGSGYKP